MFTTSPQTRWSSVQRRADLFETWRDAAQLVGDQWHAFLDAPKVGRSVAFAAYVAALDAEAAAARDLAGVLVARAA